MTSHIHPEMTIAKIIEHFPETLSVFIGNGFKQFEDPGKLKVIGSILKLNSAVKTKGYDLNSYLKMLNEAVENSKNQCDITLKTSTEEGDIRVMGLLPCPVRIPVLEEFDKKSKELEKKFSIKIGSKLEAASTGADWMTNQLSKNMNPSFLPDIFVSAGFETFFNPETIGKLKQEGFFQDVTSCDINNDFSQLRLKDPDGDYSVISIVPAVFMVNLNELGNKKIPKTWKDLFEPELEGRISLPVGDFDLFNAILLNIYKEFGEAGIVKLAKSMHSSMHPSQMVKNGNSKVKENPIVTILPYFFTRMAKASSLKIIWPEDGAMISPVFMLVKKNSHPAVKEIGQFFASKTVGEILAIKGLFPSLNCEVKNSLPEKHPFKWIGWEFLNSHNISELITKTTELFNLSVQEQNR